MRSIKKLLFSKYVVLLSLIIVLGFTLTSCSTPIENELSNSFSHKPSVFIETEEIVIALLVLAAVVSIVTQRLRIPYTIGLVLVGLSLTLVGQIPFPDITSDVILALLVPPLVFEAAFHLNFSDLRKDLPVILSLAVPGVILTTFLVGGMVSLTAGIALPIALVFGALIAATDPIAVVALFRTMGAPKRLQILLEGESLLNDGTAIVLFNLMLGIALSGKFDLGASVLQFIIVAGGGILVGVILGILISQIIGKIDNYLIETTLTTILAYGSYLTAEYMFGVSGVLAVVAAGLSSGKIGPRGMSPTTRIVVFNFWEYAAFLANSFVFLIIGLQMDFKVIINNAPVIGWAILAVLVARAVTVYSFSWIGKKIPFHWNSILFWGGLRGAISLALAMSLSTSIPNHQQLQAMAFGVVLFTLLVEGLTMKPIIQKSGILQLKKNQRNYELWHARAIALSAAQSHLHNLHREGVISDYSFQSMKPHLERQFDTITISIRKILNDEPHLREQELGDAWREVLRTQRSTLTRLFRDNVISEDVYSEMVSEVDIFLADSDCSWEEMTEMILQEHPDTRNEGLLG